MISTLVSHDREFIWKVRGFTSIQEMNEAYVSRWNEKITNEDDVYVLGDLMLGSVENIDFIKRLNGKIHIVFGNHDTPTRQRLYTELPNVVECAWAIMMTYKKHHFYMSHFPTLTGNLEKESLTKQQNLCQEQIDALREERDNLITSAGSLQTLDLESYNSQIVLLTNKKVEIAKQIDEIQTKIDGIGQDVSTFEATLQEYYNKLVEFTNEFCDTASYVVSSDASVRYTTGQIIAANGGMGRLSSTILCLLAGLVLGCCVNMIVDRKKFKEYSTGDKN